MEILQQFTASIGQFFNWLLSNSDMIRNIAQSIQSIVTIIGIIIAGCWFLQRRQINPRAKLTHKIIHHILDHKTLLIRITATIENIGNVLIKIDHAEIRINWISPLIEDVANSIQKAEKSRKLEIEFPQIDAKELNLKKSEIIIVEPGESDNIYCDFILKMDSSPKNLFEKFPELFTPYRVWLIEAKMVKSILLKDLGRLFKQVLS
jgi:hypothetical protein